MAICVTGGSSGIGLAIAERFAGPGTDVFINYNTNSDAASEAERRIAAAGGRPHVVRADVGTLDGIAELVEAVNSVCGRLDQLVHAAVAGHPEPLSEMDGPELNRAVELNGTSIAHLVREALPLLGEGSSVFFVTSAGSWKVIPGYAPLGAPKALAEHLVRYLAVELAGKGVRVNAISPGPLDTEARRRMYPDRWEQRLKEQAERNPSGRGLTFEDVSGVVELMSRPEFAMVQGQILTIDGGLSLF